MIDAEEVIGLDVSLTGTALCILRKDWSFDMHRFTSLPAKGLVGRFERYQGLSGDIFRVIDPLSGTVVFIEGYSFSSKGQAILDMAELGAYVRRMLITQQYNCGGEMPVEVAPSSLKKFATGAGNADKLKVCLSLAKRYGVQFDTNDEFDAYGLARMAACHAGWCEPETDFQRAALEAMGGGNKTKKNSKS